MTANLELRQFAEVLRAHLTSYSPVHAGRSADKHSEASLPEIEQALEEPGTTVFIYGDLGAGTSPMEHIARVHGEFRADEEGRSRDANQRLRVLIRDAVTITAYERGPAPDSAEDTEGGNMVSLSLRDGNDSISVLIDEFDQVATNEERKRFANLLREISERRSPVRFVLCGVSDLLYELLRAHESSYEYFDDKMPALGGAIGVAKAIASNHSDVPSAASHYVHIVPETLFCEMLNEPTFARNLR